MKPHTYNSFFLCCCSEGTQVAGVWSYSYAPDPTLSAGWSTAPSVSTTPSPPLISSSNSLPGADEEQFGVNPGDTLQTFLERLSLSSHLSLFQVHYLSVFMQRLSFLENKINNLKVTITADKHVVVIFIYIIHSY